MTSTIFRRMILLWWVLAVISIVVTLATERYLLPVELMSYLDSRALAEPTTLELVTLAMAFFFLIASIIGSIGLYRFKSWGRAIFLWSNVLCVVIALEPTVISGLLSASSYLYSLLTGGILFTMYLPPIGPLFENGITLAKSDEPIKPRVE